MRFGRLGEQMDVRRLTVFVARWLMDGSVPARGRREWAWARRPRRCRLSQIVAASDHAEFEAEVSGDERCRDE